MIHINSNSFISILKYFLILENYNWIEDDRKNTSGLKRMQVKVSDTIPTTN